MRLLNRVTLGLICMLLLEACQQSPMTPIQTQDFGTAANDGAFDVVAHSMGVFVVGDTRGNLDGVNRGENDAFLRKYNGGVIWARHFGTRFQDVATEVVVDSLGNSYAAGTTNGALGLKIGSTDIFLRKYNPGGSLLWTRQFGTTGFDSIRGMAIDSSDHLYILSLTQGQASFTKFDSSGILVTRKILSDTGFFLFDPVDLSLDSSGNIIIFGDAMLASGETRVAVVKYNPDLTFVWRKTFTALLPEISESLAGGLSVAGTDIYFTVTDSYFTGDGQSTPRLIKLDSSGTVMFKRVLDSLSTNQTYTPTLTTDASGNIYIAGSTKGSLPGFTQAGGYDLVVFKYSPLGSRLWFRQLGKDSYGSNKDDFVTGIAVSDALYLVGRTYGNLLGDPKYGINDADAYLAQINLLNGQVLGIDQ